MRKPSARKLARINPKFSREKIFGFTPKNILDAFKVWLSPVSSARLYRTDSGEFVVKCIHGNGGQGIYLVEQGRRGLEFRYSGHFSPEFSYREIFGETKLMRKGLATKALKSFLAMQRKNRNNRIELTTTKKSTLLLMLANGFEVDYSNESLFHRIKIKRLLKRLKANPDSVQEDLFIPIDLKWERKKEKY